MHSEEAKARAAEVARSAAENRQIANEISVQPVGDESNAKSIASNREDAIEDNYKAELLARHMDHSPIHYKAKNGVLVLTGRLRMARSAGKLKNWRRRCPTCAGS